MPGSQQRHIKHQRQTITYTANSIAAGSLKQGFIHPHPFSDLTQSHKLVLTSEG